MVSRWFMFYNFLGPSGAPVPGGLLGGDARPKCKGENKMETKLWDCMVVVVWRRASFCHPPRELRAADDVEVQVVNRLTALLAVIDHNPKAAGALVLANHACHPKQVTQEQRIGLLRGRQR